MHTQSIFFLTENFRLWPKFQLRKITSLFG